MNNYEKDYLKEVVKEEIKQRNQEDGEFLMTLFGKIMIACAIAIAVVALCISAESLFDISQYLKGLQ